MKRLPIAVLIFTPFLFLSSQATAKAPPEIIEARNLEADFIIIGKVVSISPNDAVPHFSLKITHMVKGIKELGAIDSIKINLTPQIQKVPKGLAAHSQGFTRVKVEAGALTIVYIKRSEAHPDVFIPLLQGDSVIAVDPH